MLSEIRSFRHLPVEALMKIYEKSNREQGSRKWPWESSDRQLALAEEDFYSYLRTCFFQTPGAAYYLWLEQGRPVSALRCEPFRDGVVLAALETAPEENGQGHATKLVSHTLQTLSAQGLRKVYVHIHRSNIASQKVHLRCGFALLSRGARLLDGSFHSDFDTYLIELC